MQHLGRLYSAGIASGLRDAQNIRRAGLRDARRDQLLDLHRVRRAHFIEVQGREVASTLPPSAPPGQAADVELRLRQAKKNYPVVDIGPTGATYTYSAIVNKETEELDSMKAKFSSVAETRTEERYSANFVRQLQRAGDILGRGRRDRVPDDLRSSVAYSTGSSNYD